MKSDVYTALLKITLLTYFTTLKMEAADSSETPVIIWHSTWRHIP